MFRLLDQINPLDASFGGWLLVSLDERRIPLDMLRVVYGLGGVGPLRHNLTDLIIRSDGPLATLQNEYQRVRLDFGPDVFSERFPLLSDCGPASKVKQPPGLRLHDEVSTPRDPCLFASAARTCRGARPTCSVCWTGFLVSLDERRIPLDMLRVVYGLGGVGPLSELNLEGFMVADDEVSTPTPAGSPWSTPNPAGIRSALKKPARNFTDMRGGGRVVGVWGDFMFTVAHYYTYLDGATGRVVTPTGGSPLRLSEFRQAARQGEVGRYLFDNFQTNILFPKVQISGATLTFGLPSLSAIVRSEFAYFYAEPFFKNASPSQLLGPIANPDNFALTPGYSQVACPPSVSNDVCLRYKSDIDRSDVIRWSLGMDMDRYIQLLNPQQSFVISGQIFGTHILDFNDTKLSSVRDSFGFGQFAIPVLDPNRRNTSFVNMDQHQLVNTLSISTAYRSGAISPALIFLYDWQGAWLVQPGITFTRDPFRFIIQYNYIDGQYNGIGFLRDRDNLIVQLEVVI